ncbi:hypothetical protein TKK_0001135 [Trichogramma kaykai]
MTATEQLSGAGSPQQFCLRWNNYQTNLTNVFDQLLQSESFVDVTLACDGNSVKAHKMVLSACSPYFQTLFCDNPCQHPIVIMKDIKWPELKAAVEFMYKGEINVSQEQIGPLLKVAETLKIRGLADVGSEHELAKSAEDQLSVASVRAAREQQRDRGSSDQQQRKKRRHMNSLERSPSNGSPELRAASEERDSASTGGQESLHGGLGGPGSASTPRSLGSPGVPSISVTPQINLHELSGSLALSLQSGSSTPHGMSSSTSAQSQAAAASLLVGHHVASGVAAAAAGHVTPASTPVNHLNAHVVAQQLSAAQQQHRQQEQQQQQQQQHHRGQQQQQPTSQEPHHHQSLVHHHHHQQPQQHHPSIGDDLEIKPGIAEMIREEERVSDARFMLPLSLLAV